VFDWSFRIKHDPARIFFVLAYSSNTYLKHFSMQNTSYERQISAKFIIYNVTNLITIFVQFDVRRHDFHRLLSKQFNHHILVPVSFGVHQRILVYITFLLRYVASCIFEILLWKFLWWSSNSCQVIYGCLKSMHILITWYPD
jgi:hypothetical protein